MEGGLQSCLFRGGMGGGVKWISGRGWVCLNLRDVSEMGLLCAEGCGALHVRTEGGGGVSNEYTWRDGTYLNFEMAGPCGVGKGG